MRIWAGVWLVWTLGCGGPAAPPITMGHPPPETAAVDETPPEPEDTAPHAWLYRVSREGTPDSYLLGTMHIGINVHDALPSPLDAALFRADSLAMEIDLREARRFFESGGGSTPEERRRARRTRLDRLLGRETFDRLAAEMARIVPAEILRVLPPALIANHLMKVRMAEVEALEEGRTPIPGQPSSTSVDRSIFEWGIGSNLPFVPLETPEQAMAALREIADGDAAEALHALIDDPEAARAESRRLRDAYISLDEDRLFAILSEMPAADRAIMLEGRNQAWMERLVPELTRGNAFVAVGCGHLLGPGSVPELLRAQGFTVERVLGDGGFTPTDSGPVRLARAE